MSKAKRYTEVVSNSCDHYYIPIERFNDWYDWCNQDEDTEEAWETPHYAVLIDGGQLTFTNPKIERLG